ncbi:MAG: hypothetical protein CMF50_05620 [Legionellales bacterium]|nr:hypothetical protein [Legionellales bacterium]
MKSLVSIRLNDDLLQAIKAHAHSLHLSQADYIRKAIENMNRETEKQLLKQKLEAASLKVRKESMQINTEFSEIEDDPDA